MDQSLLILGISHRSAPVAVRERLAYADAEIGPALRRMRASCDAIGEAALISTCNRVEAIVVTADAARAADAIVQFFATDRGVDAGAFEPSIYRHDGLAAARHLFRVGASLDSMVVGEPQILGQLKSAYAAAAKAGSVGAVLHRAFHKAFTVAKRVRKGTLIGHGSVSVATAAVGLARRIFDSLEDKTVMMLGAGEMAELTARHLKANGIRSLLIASRTFDRAVALARDLGGTAVPFDGYIPYLQITDVLIGSLAATAPVLGPEQFDSIIRRRRYRPMFILDLGVPRNFDERLNQIENVYVYDIDDLGAAVNRSIDDREREAQKAEEIVALETESFARWLDGLDLVPTIKDIRYSIDRIRDAELERNRGWLATMAPDERARVEGIARSLTNKLLHRVVSGLRRRADDEPGTADAAEIARELLCDDFADAHDDDSDAGGGDGEE
jgi:glutamyl-tRNA reductase